MFCTNLKAQDMNNNAVYDSLKNIADTSKSASVRMDVFLEICNSTSDVSLIYTNSWRLYNLSKQVGDRYMHARGASMLAYANGAQGDNKKALELAFEAFDIFSELDSVSHVVNSLHLIGSIYANSNNVDKALHYYSLAHDMANRNDLVYEKCSISNSIGYMYLEIGLNNPAIDYFSMTSKESLGPDALPVIYDSKLGLIKAYVAKYQYYHEIQQLEAAYNFVRQIDVNDIIEKDLMLYLEYSVTAPEVYIERAKLFRRGTKENLDTALSILNLGEQISAQNGVAVYDAAFATLKAKILIEKGMYKEVPPILVHYDTISSSVSLDMINTRKDYYIRTKNYSNALVYSQLYNKMLHSKYSISFAYKAEIMPAERQYQEKLDMIREDAMERDKKHESLLAWWNGVKNTLIIAGVILLLILLHILFGILDEKAQKKALLSQTDELASKNGTLKEYQNEIQKQCEEIEKQTQLLNEQNLELGSMHKYLVYSIETAQNIQRAVVPSEEKVLKVFGDAFVMWRPLDIVSGDFYWMAVRKSRRYLMVADCTGHGVPGAMLSILGVSILNHLLTQNLKLDAAQVLELFKAKYLEAISHSDIDDGMDVALLIFDEGKVQYAGANRPLVQVRGTEIIEHKPTRICIGHNLYKENVTFENNVIEYQPGDILYAFSDGITDQFGGRGNQEKFGVRRLKQMLSEIACLETPMQKVCIENQIDTWRNVHSADPSAQLDDELIIGVRL